MAIISIIVPVYKVEDYLERCIKSLINQTLKDIEIILVDDGSPDRSREICDKFKEIDNRIKVIHKNNGGLSDARNAGLEVASGEYIAFVDSDDWIDSDMMEVLHNLSQKYDADIVECSWREIYTDKIREETNNTEQIIEGNNIFALRSQLQWKYFKSVVWNKLYKKYLFNYIRFPKGRLHEDEFTTYKLFYFSKKLVYVDISKYNYDKTREESITATFKEKNLDIIDAMQERLEFFKKYNLTILMDEMYNMYFWILLDRLYQCYICGISTKRVHYIIDQNRKKYFINMKLNISSEYKFELSLLQVSYRCFIKNRKSERFKKFVLKHHKFFVGKFKI